MINFNLYIPLFPDDFKEVSFVFREYVKTEITEWYINCRHLEPIYTVAWTNFYPDKNLSHGYRALPVHARPTYPLKFSAT